MELRSSGVLVRVPVQTKRGRCSGGRGRCQNTGLSTLEQGTKPTYAQLVTHPGVDSAFLHYVPSLSPPKGINWLRRQDEILGLYFRPAPVLWSVWRKSCAACAQDLLWLLRKKGKTGRIYRFQLWESPFSRSHGLNLLPSEEMGSYPGKHKELWWCKAC